MYNQTMLDWLRDTTVDGFKQFVLYHEVILISIPVFFGLRQGRQTWMNIMHVWLFIESLVEVIFPEKMLSILVEGRPDDVHVQSMRGVGLLIMFSCVSYWLLYKSADSTVHTSLVLGTTLNSVCSIIAFGYVITHPPKKDSPIKLHESLMSPFYSYLIYTAINLYFVLKSTDWGGYVEIPGSANRHLRANFVFLTVLGVLFYALPQWIIKTTGNIDKIDALHAYLARTGGAMLLTMGILSGRAANFLRPSDKDAYMLSHWMYYVTVTMAGIYDLFCRRSQVTWLQVGLQTGVDLVLVLNATAALNTDLTIFQRILIPRVKDLYSDVLSLFKVKKN